MRISSALLLSISLTAPVVAFGGKDITGKGTTVAKACWFYNLEANKHARTNNSCWAKCVPKNVLSANGEYIYIFNNPNEQGSCGSRYDGGSGLSEEIFYTAYPPPDGIDNPYSPPTGPTSAIVKNKDSLANIGVLLIKNQSNRPVRYECRVFKEQFGSRQLHSVEISTVQPNSNYSKEFHSFDPAYWTGECIKT